MSARVPPTIIDPVEPAQPAIDRQTKIVPGSGQELQATKEERELVGYFGRWSRA
jgi:hypothetical protein